MLEVALCAACTASARYSNSSTLRCKSSNCAGQVLYCNQAWSGFCSAAVRDRIDLFVSSERSGYCADSVPPVKKAIPRSDNSLFKRVLCNARNARNAISTEQQAEEASTQSPTSHKGKFTSSVISRTSSFEYCTLGHNNQLIYITSM